MSLTESITLVDRLIKSVPASFTESLTLDDQLAKTANVAFTESLPLDDQLAKTANVAFTESLTLGDQLAKTANVAFTESLPLGDQLAKTTTASLTESLTLGDQLAKTTNVAFTESLTLDDQLTKTTNVAFTESLTLGDQLKAIQTAGLSESLALVDSEIENLLITVPIGGATVLFGINPGGAGCSKNTFNSFQSFALVESNNGCLQEDKMKITSGTTDEEDMVLFYLDNGGFDADTQVIGLESGNEINFKSRSVAGTLKIKLVQVNPSTQAIEELLDTKSESVPINSRIIITDIRPLAGLVDSGSTFGILLSFVADSTTNSDKEIKWGKDNNAAKQFRLTLDIILSSSLTESLSLSDQLKATQTIALTESLALDDRLIKSVPATFFESLT
jgi:hypothetical protein